MVRWINALVHETRGELRIVVRAMFNSVSTGKRSLTLHNIELVDSSGTPLVADAKTVRRLAKFGGLQKALQITLSYSGKQMGTSSSDVLRRASERDGAGVTVLLLEKMSFARASELDLAANVSALKVSVEEYLELHVAEATSDSDSDDGGESSSSSEGSGAEGSGAEGSGAEGSGVSDDSGESSSEGSGAEGSGSQAARSEEDEEDPLTLPPRGMAFLVVVKADSSASPDEPRAKRAKRGRPRATKLTLLTRAPVTTHTEGVRPGTVKKAAHTASIGELTLEESTPNGAAEVFEHLRSEYQEKDLLYQSNGMLYATVPKSSNFTASITGGRKMKDPHFFAWLRGIAWYSVSKSQWIVSVALAASYVQDDHELTDENCYSDGAQAELEVEGSFSGKAPPRGDAVKQVAAAEAATNADAREYVKKFAALWPYTLTLYHKQTMVAMLTVGVTTHALSSVRLKKLDLDSFTTSAELEEAAVVGTYVPDWSELRSVAQSERTRIQLSDPPLKCGGGSAAAATASTAAVPVAAPPSAAATLAAAMDRRTLFLATQAHEQRSAGSAPGTARPPVVYAPPPLSQEDVPVRCYTAAQNYRSDMENLLSYNRGDTLETMLDGVALRKSTYCSWGIFARITSGDFEGASGYVKEKHLEAADN